MSDPPPPPPYGAPEQPPYGAAPPPPYGGYGATPYGQPPFRDHPQATLVLVLGIVGLVVCGVVAPFAWVMGNRVIREIDASGGQLGGRSNANAGRILGIVGSIIIALSLLFLIGVLVVAVASVSTSPG